jgi:putative heme-binding domain-containing protein
VRGKGAKIGPDLSNLFYRDARSVLRDITDPSAAIHPDYVPYTIVLADQRVLSGLLRAAGEDKVRLVDSNAQETVLLKQEIRELAPSSVSIMPKGLVDPLGPKALKDLLAFLTSSPTAPSPGAPPPRTRAEVDAVMGPAGSHLPSGRPLASDKARSLHIVLVAGPKDHGPGEHDYPAWQRKWKELLGQADGVRVSTAFGWPDRGHFDFADLMVFYFWNHDWSEERYAEIDAFLARGGGMVLLHSAVIPDREPEKLAARAGLAWKPNETKYRHGPLDLEITAPAGHPITKGFSKTHLVDETYWPLVGNATRIDVLATAQEEGKPRPVVWTYTKGNGKVFATILGHYSWTFDDPLFRLLLLRGVAWAAGEPAERFEPLAVHGVPVRD